MFGLSGLTTFMVFGTPIIGVILAVIFGLTFNEDKQDWWTFEDLFKKK